MLDLFSTIVSSGNLNERRATAGRLLFESLGFIKDHPKGGNLRSHFSKSKESSYLTNEGIAVRTWPPTEFRRDNYLNIAERAAGFICADQDGAVGSAFKGALNQIMGNAVQHSRSDRALFAAVRTDYYASFVVLDKGVGVSKTFSETLDTLEGEPSNEQKAEIALRWAMMECISSGDESSSNRGRGLPLLKEACSSALIISDGAFNYNHKGPSFFPLQYWDEVQGRKGGGHIQDSLLPIFAELGVVVEAYVDLKKIRHALSLASFDCAAARQTVSKEYGEKTAVALFKE